jgi:glycerate 2-kinase
LSLSLRPDAHQLLRDLYAAATSAVAPGPALIRRLETLSLPYPRRPIWLLALGKAAVPMASAAAQFLQDRGQEPAGGIVVAPAGQAPHPRLTFIQGDHPEPGAGSLAAAEALARTTERVGDDDEVWVLLSGGTTSLVGAPEPELSAAELSTIYHLLLGSGLDITAMNRVRKRFSRWGGGKLARALAPARVRVYVVSDVIGDDLASIGSGPCVPDPTTAAEVCALLEGADLWHRLPGAGRKLVMAAVAGKTAETPKAGDPAFARVTLEVIASNRLALEAAAQQAEEFGLLPLVVEPPIAGEASAVGGTLASQLLHECSSDRTPRSKSPTGTRCLIWGGETTVSLGEHPAGLGGRCQELALAAAQSLSAAEWPVTLLAAGTDGRDGPTDAAGAIVDRSTWQAIVRAGRDPGRDLAAHNAYHALDVVGALLRPGLTGTNVMDIVIGICQGKEKRNRGGKSANRKQKRERVSL